MSDRPFAYICSPLRGDVEANMARAREYSRQVFEAGYCPITPHIYFPQFLKDDIPAERESGMQMGESLLPLCRVLVICGDTISEGMRQEVLAAQGLGIETCALENIPPIPSLKNYRDNLTNLDNFGIAVSLIEGMTGCRFTAGVGGVFIYPDSDAYLAVNLKNKWDYKTGLCSVTFDANIRSMGHPMKADGVLKLQQEINRTHALLNLLESREFVLTQDDMEELYNSIRQRDSVKDTQPRDAEKPSVREKIAAAREQTAAGDKPKRGKILKSRSEEL